MPYDMIKLPPWWLRGLPADLWLQHGRIVEGFIKEQKLMCPALLSLWERISEDQEMPVER